MARERSTANNCNGDLVASKRKPHNGNAGYIASRKNPITGCHVTAYDGIPAMMDTEGGRWQTVCEIHGSIISHPTKALALHHLKGCPSYWCELLKLIFRNGALTGMKIMGRNHA